MQPSKITKRPAAALLGLGLATFPNVSHADSLEIGKNVQISGKVVVDKYHLPDDLPSQPMHSFIALVPDKPVTLTGSDPNADVVANDPGYLKEIALVDVATTPNSLPLETLVGKRITVSGVLHGWEEALQPVHPFVMMKQMQVIDASSNDPVKSERIDSPSPMPFINGGAATGWSVAPVGAGSRLKPAP